VIETEHLLVGLSQAGRKAGLIVPERLGVTPPMIHAELAKMVHQGLVPPPWGKLPYGSSGKKSLDYAIEEARSLGNPYVGSEHLLLGILREQDGTAARVLANLGVGLDQAREELQKLTEEVRESPFTGELNKRRKHKDKE
jgi:ATP-dependent Clp protease ATP-binding subunit ClpC